MLLFYGLFQVFNDRHGRLDSHIAHDQSLLKLLVEIIINRGEAGKDGIHSGYNVFSGLRETFHKAREKALFLLFHMNPPIISDRFRSGLRRQAWIRLSPAS